MSFWKYNHLIYGSADTSTTDKIQVISKLKNINSKYYGSLDKTEDLRQKLVIKICPCCSSKIKIFAEVEKYRCGYCKTNVFLKTSDNHNDVSNNLALSNKPQFFLINKLLEKVSSSFNLEPYILINLENLKKFEEDYEKCENKIEMMANFVFLSFNLTAMAKSFVVDNLVDSIDYKMLTSYYNHIFFSKNKMHKKLKYKMILRLYDLVSNVNVEKNLTNNNHLRAILIILECPFFKDSIFMSKTKDSLYKKIQVIAYKILARCICFIANCSQEKKLYVKILLIKTGNEEIIQKYLEFDTVLINHIFSKTIEDYKKTKDMGFGYFFEAEQIKDSKSNANNDTKNTNLEINLENYKNNLFLLSFFNFSKFLFEINDQKEFIADKTFFYNVYIDYIDIKKDFEEKEICNNSNNEYRYLFVTNFPHMIPLGCKFRFLESRFRDTMNFKAEEAFLKSINKRAVGDLYFYLSVHRVTVLRDTFKQINDQLEIYKTLKYLKQENIINSNVQGNYLNDTFLNNIEMTMHKSLRVDFAGEPGLDASGLKREWFQKVILELFNTQKNYYFKNLDSRKFWFKDDKTNNYLISQTYMDVYFIIGIVIGLSFYNCISTYIPLPVTFYKKLLDIPLTIRDFREVYPQEYLYLIKVNNMDEEELSKIDLRFEVTIVADEVDSNKENFKKKSYIDVELVPNGSETRVTTKNKLEFIKCYMNYYLSNSVEISFKRIQSGFKFIINETLFFDMVQYYEIYQYYNNGLMETTSIEQDYDARYDLIRESDIRLLSRVTKYMNEGRSNYNKWTEEESETIKWFWELVIEKTNEDRIKNRYEDSLFYRLMLFITGNGSLPVCGLHILELKISKMRNPKDPKATLYPLAHTCFNELCLYETYESKEHLYDSLLMSISHDNSTYGFR